MPHPHLPPEICDSIIDLLHNEPQTLGRCCLVSKSWIPRARKNLFAVIRFSSRAKIDKWKEVFPDPSNFPALYTHTLEVNYFTRDTSADVVEGGWIPNLSRVVRLELHLGSKANFAPFYRFSHTVKDLCVECSSLPYLPVFNLVRSLPFLEDLFLSDIRADPNPDDSDGVHIVVPSLTSPPLTGSLKLSLGSGISNAVRPLLDMPNGLHFRKLTLSLFGRGDFRYIPELVAACSATLEYLCVSYKWSDEPGPTPIDLSNATKLKDVELTSVSPRDRWITLTLETITSKHRDLQQISVNINNTSRLIQNYTDAMWPDLDSLLVKLWELCSIRTNIVYNVPLGGTNTDLGVRLLPESMARGIIDLVENPKLRL